jgi:hypothetical protein
LSGAILSQFDNSWVGIIMIKMRVKPNEAKKLIGQIPHAMCQSGLPTKWIEGGEAGVTAQSICWLYCWAKTGQNSADAAYRAKLVFNQIFDKPYEWFDARVPYKWALEARYRRGSIEDELERLLAAH